MFEKMHDLSRSLLISVIFLPFATTVSNPSIDASTIQSTRKPPTNSLSQPLSTAIINKVKLPHFGDPPVDDTSL